jgi:hypothetical protein
MSHAPGQAIGQPEGRLAGLIKWADAAIWQTDLLKLC